MKSIRLFSLYTAHRRGDNVRHMPGPNLRQEHPNINWDEVARLFHALWYFGPRGEPPWETTQWMGVPALKCPFDTWIYQEIIHRTRPDVIIETGTRYGGSALCM